MPEPVENELAIIVVNYGSTDLLSKNLVRSSTALPDAHVIVVDNFSSADERRRATATAKQHNWHLVTPRDNAGFGAGVNLGVDRARALGARDFLLLNPDAYIEPAGIDLLRTASQRDRQKVYAPRVVDSEGRNWFAGADLYLTDGKTMGSARRDERPGEERWEWLSGACMLIPDVAWDLAGGFDESYFLYWEDVDFSHRVVKGGGGLALVLDAVAVHDEGGTQSAASSRAKSANYYYFNIRNRMLFAIRHLDAGGVRRWEKGLLASAREVLLRGGRRQFLRPIPPLSAAVRGVRDARRLVREHFERHDSTV